MIFQVKTRAHLKVFELDITTRDSFLFSGSREFFVSFFFFLTFFPHIGKDFSLTHRPWKDRRTVSFLPICLAILPKLWCQGWIGNVSVQTCRGLLSRLATAWVFLATSALSLEFLNVTLLLHLIPNSLVLQGVGNSFLNFSFCCCSVAQSCLFATPWTAACQASLSFLSPGVFSNSCPLNPYVNCEVCQASVLTIPRFQTYILLYYVFEQKQMNINNFFYFCSSYWY